MKRFLIYCTLPFLVFSCSQVQKKEKQIITVSILPQKYFVERIAGDRFDIHVITPPGASHETYEPTPLQIKPLDESVLFIANGYLLLENHLLEKFGSRLSGKTVDLSAGIDLIAGDIVDHGDHVHMHGVDPHYWLSPKEVKIQAHTILNALIKTDPDNSDIYEANFAEFARDLDLLDAHMASLFSETTIKTILIYHPAFSYLAREYGFEQLALEMDGKEPTGAHMKYIIDQVGETGIKTIFIQSQFNTLAADVVAKEIGGSVEVLDPLPENWLDYMYEIAHKIQKALNP